eukprot:1696212-Rhodomonas_salina.1
MPPGCWLAGVVTRGHDHAENSYEPALHQSRASTTAGKSATPLSVADSRRTPVPIRAHSDTALGLYGTVPDPDGSDSRTSPRAVTATRSRPQRSEWHGHFAVQENLKYPPPPRSAGPTGRGAAGRREGWESGERGRDHQGDTGCDHSEDGGRDHHEEGGRDHRGEGGRDRREEGGRDHGGNGGRGRESARDRQKKHEGDRYGQREERGEEEGAREEDLRRGRGGRGSSCLLYTSPSPRDRG